MSFISTYNSLSIRGWKTNNPVGATLDYIQTINSPVQSNGRNFGTFVSLSGNSTFLAINNYIFVDNNFNTPNDPLYTLQYTASEKINYLNITGNILTYQGGGALYVYFGSSWSFKQVLTPSNPGDSINFGYHAAVDASGNTIIVAANPSLTTNNGNLYNYQYDGNTYIETQIINLTGPSKIGPGNVKLNISADGNYIIAGCTYDGTSSASCYADIFVKSGNTYNYQTRLFPSDSVAGDNFGNAVSLNYDGSIALIGAPYKNSNAGAAYTFIRTGNTWVQKQKITSNKSSANDYFGSSCFISSDSSAIIIGAPLEDTGGTNRGSAFIYYNTDNIFYLTQELTANAGGNNDQFGTSVAICNGSRYIACVGAPVANNSPYVGVGKVFTYAGIS